MQSSATLFGLLNQKTWIKLMLAASIAGFSMTGVTAFQNLAGGSAFASTNPHPAQQLHQQSLAPAIAVENTSTKAVLTETSAIEPLQDGTYLYGQSPIAGTIGSMYMVFDVNGEDVVGAFYMPNSSFDCFRGSFHVNELMLTVRDSYQQDLFSYVVPLTTSNTLVSTGKVSGISQQPQGLYSIPDVSETDENILATCRTQSW